MSRSPRPLPRVLVPLIVIVVLSTLIHLGTVTPALWLIAMLVAIATVFWPVRQRIPGVLLVFGSVLLGLTIVNAPALTLRSHPRDVTEDRRSWIESGSFDERLPTAIHLIFDEMMSSGAIDESLPGGPTTRQELYALAERYELRLYDSVYSRSFFSGVSIPNLFNAEWLGKTRMPDRSPELLQSLPHNAYFDELAGRGYRTAVFQTSHLNFCTHSRVELCETFASFDAGAAADSRLDVPSRVLHVVNILLRSYEPSYVSRYGQRLLSILVPRAQQPRILGAAGRFDVQRFPEWFNGFVDFVEQVPRGAHVFGHFMVPHAPYVLSADCQVGEDGGVGYYLGTRVAAEARDEARSDYYARYFAQLNCVRSQLAKFFAAVDRNAELRDAIVIVHGDHGSRISVGNLVEDYEPEDYVANYATFFAVRGPGVKPGVDCEFVSLPEVFRRYASANFDPPPIDRVLPPLVVRTKLEDSRRVEAPMPRFGCAVRQQSREGG